jgi:hypothetical protein
VDVVAEAGVVLLGGIGTETRSMELLADGIEEEL